MSQPTHGVTVIIPVFNSRHRLHHLLQRLRDQDHPKSLTEIVIVDDGSTDGTATFLRENYPEVCMISTENRGSYHARNVGIARSKHHYLAFTDADCQPASDWLSTGVAALASTGSDLVAGAVATVCIDPESAVEFYDRSFGINQAFFAQKKGFGATANLFATRAVADKVGGFDNTLRSGGDVKFCNHAIELGAVLQYEPRAVVEHDVRDTWLENYRKVVRMSGGLARVGPVRQHFRLLRLSRCRKEYFDYEKFRTTSTAWFRFRVRGVYYSLRLCYLAAYTAEIVRLKWRQT